MPVTSVWHPSMGTKAPPIRPSGTTGANPPIGSKRGWAGMTLGLLAVGVLAWWVTHSAIFEARSISVTGNKRLSRQAVLRLADLSGATNVLWFSPGGTVGRLESSPWIVSARVDRSLPGTISVSVTERVPVAVVGAGSRRYLVAADRTVLGRASDSTGLPLVSIGPAPVVRPGMRLSAISGPLHAILGLSRRLRPQVVSARIGTGQEGLVLVLRSGVRAVYGDSTDAEAKGRALAAVLDWAGRNGVRLSYVDVRAPVTPAAFPQPSTPANATKSLLTG